MTTALLRVVPLLALVAALSIAPAAAAHPQDGPHADVRIRLDDRALRWNIGLNLAYMDEIVDVGRERMDAIEPVEEEILRDAVLEHLLEDNRVVIDGREVDGEVVTWNFRRGDPTLLPLFPRAGMRGLIRVEIIIDYPLEKSPDEIEMTWADYPLDVLSAELEGGEPAPLVLLAQLQAEGVIDLIEFSEGIPTVTWLATGLTVEERLQPVPDLADAVAAAGMGATPAPASPATVPDQPADVTAPGPSTARPMPPGSGLTLPLGGLVLLAVALFTGLVAFVPRRPTSARVLGGTLTLLLLASGGVWTFTGPTVRGAPASVAGSVAAAPPGRSARGLRRRRGQ